MAGAVEFLGMLIGKRPKAGRLVDAARKQTDAARDAARKHCRSISPEEALRGLTGEKKVRHDHTRDV